jgi:hypothetical protein
MTEEKSIFNDIAHDQIQDTFFSFNKNFGIWEAVSKEELYNLKNFSYLNERGKIRLLEDLCLKIVCWNNRYHENRKLVFYPTDEFLISFNISTKDIEIIRYNTNEFELFLPLLNECSILSLSPCNLKESEIRNFFSNLKSLDISPDDLDLRKFCPVLHDFLNASFSYYNKNESRQENISHLISISHAVCLKSVNHGINQSLTFEKIFCLSGPGASGKSTFQNFLTNLAGIYSTHSTTMTAICGDPRFESLYWINKSLLIINEISFKDKQWEKLFPILKAASGGDLIPVEKKFGAKFNAYIPALLFLSSNERLSISFENDFVSQKRRFVTIYFNSGLNPEERDLDLSIKLQNECILFSLLTLYLYSDIFTK